jgi:hypothetical protein
LFSYKRREWEIRGGSHIHLINVQKENFSPFLNADDNRKVELFKESLDILSRKMFDIIIRVYPASLLKTPRIKLNFKENILKENFSAKTHRKLWLSHKVFRSRNFSSFSPSKNGRWNSIFISINYKMYNISRGLNE